MMPPGGPVSQVALRILGVPFGVLAVSTLTFLLVNVPSSDPATVIAGAVATDDQIHEINVDLGLTGSLWSRYQDYVGALVHGDLGSSYYTGRPVMTSIIDTLPKTLELVIPSLVVAIVVGGAVGFVGGYFRRRLPDTAARTFVAVIQSIPDFFLGLLLVFVFSFRLGITPSATGRLGLFDEPPPERTHFLLIDTMLAGRWDLMGSVLSHMVLPVLTLGLFSSAIFAKATRSALIPALGSQQVEFARASGLPSRRVIGYAFLEARTSILTYGAMLFAGLVGGAAIVETVFSWGGIGQWSVSAMLQLDLPAIQGFVLVTGLFTLVTYLVLDLVIVAINPQARAA